MHCKFSTYLWRIVPLGLLKLMIRRKHIPSTKLWMLLALASCLTACSSEHSDPLDSAAPARLAEIDPMKPVTDHGAPAEANNGMPIPGPRSCFWRYGPHSADPYINLAYPDAAVFYWAAVFSMPQGARLQLTGDFAHARYQSFISYDERGRPIESLADYLIQPDSTSSNPYVLATNRNSENRSYTVELVNEAPSEERSIGELNRDETSNVLHAPAYADGQQVII